MSTQNSHMSPATPKDKAVQQHSNKGSNSHKEQARVPPTIISNSDNASKNNKVEGKNKKSLHQKQQQVTQERCSNHQQQSHSQKPSNSATSPSGRKGQKNLNGTSKPSNAPTTGGATTSSCSTLDQFAFRAQELKADICTALAKQASHHQTIDQPIEVVKLKNDILKLSGLQATTSEEKEVDNADTSLSSQNEDNVLSEDKPDVLEQPACALNVAARSSKDNLKATTDDVKVNQEQTKKAEALLPRDNQDEDHLKHDDVNPVVGYKSDVILTQSLDKLNLLDQEQKTKQPQSKVSRAIARTRQKDEKDIKSKSSDEITESFEPLNARLDSNSKLVALLSSLQSHFKDAPQLLEPVCRKLVEMSDQNEQLLLSCEKYQTENQRLSLVKQKLENLCRELQKSNNAIRIESLDLIKVEQSKAKEQTTKIQSTLSGVIKLFDENQQRNMSLRQENQDLQTKLKSLLDHCDNWEKSVEASLRQRDIENRLIKTELAKANLLKNEEKEKFLSEKQELLQILSMMQEQQHRIEGQEAKLRSDLSSYASKYDQCQAVISQGMDKFHTESQRMLKQIEVSRADYKALLSKYESSNRKMVKLLEEKQSWARTMNLAKKKNETLEKLCRALRDRKSDGKNENACPLPDKVNENPNLTTEKNNINSNLKVEAGLDKVNDNLTSSAPVVEPDEFNSSDKIAIQTDESCCPDEIHMNPGEEIPNENNVKAV